MPNVTNLKVKLQTGSDSTYLATWDFKETIKKTTTTGGSSGSFAAGAWVTIKSGATYYNGVAIPSWVMSDTWQLIQVRGDRAVLGKNKSGSHNIVSAISTKYLNGGSGATSGSTTTTEVTTNYLDHYTVQWFYDTGDGIWFDGGTSDDVKEKYATYSAPSNAINIKVSVKPVSKTYKVNDKDVSYWTGSLVSTSYSLSSDPPEKPSTPDVEIDKYTLTAKIENISDSKADQIEFEIYSGTNRVNVGTVSVLTCRATFTCSINAGGDYRVRCRAINLLSDSKNYSEWSDFCNPVSTIPSVPSAITTCKASSETSVLLEWTAVEGATSYDLEYTTETRYFDNSSETTTTTGIEFTHYEKTGLETGDEYFFRVRAVNEKGASGWSDIASVTIGKDPAAPTTWSSTTTAITGEPLTLYWVHNAEDNSSQTYAELELYIDGVKETYTIKNTEDEETKDKTSSYDIDTSEYIEGTKIQWRVRTAGITKAYGDWSIQRTVDIYAPATLELSITDADANSIDTLTTFPFYVSALAGPKTQQPIGYHLVVKANTTYRTVDNVGNDKIVNAGEEVYSKYFDISEALLVEMSANNIDLANNMSYTVSCTVTMNSGLLAETSLPFTVSWSEVAYEPDAEIGIDTDSYIAYISPYCIQEDETPIADVTLSVYRKEFDGTFKELATGIDTASNTYIVDPHPALDYARYRIVATSKSTGAVSYYDPPGYPVGGKSVIIQWDDNWTNFDASTGDTLETPPWTGSLLKIPYNIDVSDSSKSDTTLVEYIGRSHPVSYYGTQVGFTSNWSMEIPKSDKDILYALRRLSTWMGDVYVREPSGSGYWASITVSFSQKHREVTIPVTLSITRVEGGI